MPNTNQLFDTLLQLKDAGAVTANGTGQVGGAARIIDLGSSLVAGDWVVDVGTIDTTTGDELYQLLLEGSDSSDFSTGTPAITPLAVIHMGGGTTIPGAGVTATAAGRFVQPFRNEQNGKVFRYVRVEHLISGTTPSINYVSYLSPRHSM